MPEFEEALTQLPDHLKGEVTRHWQDFVAVRQQAGIDLPTDEGIVSRLLRVWACSDFVARSCIRDPAMLAALLGSGDLDAAYEHDHFRDALKRTLEDVQEEAALGVVLRRFRRREMVRIAWRDLMSLASLHEILLDLSNLADALIEAALDSLYDWQCERFGVPRNAADQRQCMVVLGLGKLGGQELNFSSDIDLIFAFPEKGQSDSRGLSNEEFFRRLGQRLIKILSEITDEGFVFRVDMRLRPFGNAGPLVMPFGAMEDYYQTHGREWERYALIKARVVAGDREQGERLLDNLRPFVYRRYLDFGAFDELRNMKAMIAKEGERKGLRNNVKLGPGGIREIEFIAQAFQLIYGGREPGLRQRSLCSVLDYLTQSDRLPDTAIVSLKQAYQFLRQTENRLQAWADQQTHDLPEDEPAKQRLAYAMQYPDWHAFAAVLINHVQAVSSQFEQVFATSRNDAKSQAALPDFTAIWKTSDHTEASLKLLGNAGFDHPEEALTALHKLRNSFSHRALSARGHERMNRLIPLLLQAVAGCDQPSSTLERTLHILERIARRSVYLALLVESPVALAQLVKLCESSVWISRYLARYPLLLDDLLNPVKLYSPLDQTQLQQELERDLEQAGEDPEQRIDALRHFKQSNVLRVAAADVSGAVPIMKVSDYLTDIAEVLLTRTLELIWADLLPRFGQPECIIDSERYEPVFAIVAYGKLGGIELGYGSDLDLVFLHDSSASQQQTGGPRVIDNASFFAKLAQRLIHMLTAHTAAGVLYEVDTRLRPSGRSGLLVSSFDAFAEYQRNQAWTWEHQALVRARVVAGPDHLAESFAQLRREILCRPRDIAVLRSEVREMRERMRSELSSSETGVFDLKQDRGGIADIEFIVQYAVIAGAGQFPELLTYTDNIRQLDGLEQVGLLDAEDAALLRDAYRAMRRRLHLAKLQEQSGLISDFDEFTPFCEGVTRIWRQLLEQDT